MQLPELRGVIRRRLLINFRVDPAVVQRHLPLPFRPKLHNGCSVAGICLISLDEIRPRVIPGSFGVKSENAAHRFAVEWDDLDGIHTGVYINRRDTGSYLNHLAGGRLFPGEHHQATFQTDDDGRKVSLEMASTDGEMQIELAGHEADELPESSIFRSIEEASEFFKSGSLGYSSTADGSYLDGLSLQTESWRVAPFNVDRVQSSYFDNRDYFPEGTIEFDCALVMRNVPHVWRAAPKLQTTNSLA
jgi:hypothetical protein